MKIEPIKYYPKGSDLMVVIHNVKYQNDTYAKVSLSLINKKNGIVYKYRRRYKLYKNKIQHWVSDRLQMHTF